MDPPPASAHSRHNSADSLETCLGELAYNTGSLLKYDMGKELGRGKFSVVYKAAVKGTRQTVAIKRIAIFDIMDSKSRKKTLREVELLRNCQPHQHIIRYLDSFIDSNELYIVFEWAELGDLRRMLKKRTAFYEEATVWQLFGQICSAVAHLHSQRIMHRDIKPANIFLSLHNELKVGDLGLGRELGADSVEAFSKVGTPLYMSPEVLHGQGYDFKSDVWSLGCILYELAAMHSPFDAGGAPTLYDIFQRISACNFPPLPPHVSSQLRQVVNSSLSLDPTQRPSAADLVAIAQQMAMATQPPVCALQVVADALDMLKLLCSAAPLLLRNPPLALLRAHCQSLPASLLSSPKALDKPMNCNAYFGLCHTLLLLLHGSSDAVPPPPLVPASPRTAACVWLLSQFQRLPLLPVPPCTAAELDAGTNASLGRFLHAMASAWWEKEKFVVETPAWVQAVHGTDDVVEDMVGEEERSFFFDASTPVTGEAGGCCPARGVCAVGGNAVIDGSCPVDSPSPSPLFAPPPLPPLMRARVLHLKLSSGLNDIVSPKLLRLQHVATEEMVCIRAREASLQRQTAASTTRLKSAAQQHSAQLLQLHAARTKVGGQMRDADALQGKIDVMCTEVNKTTAALSSQQQLEKLKRALASIKAEIRALDMQVALTARLVEDDRTNLRVSNSNGGGSVEQLELDLV